MKKSKFSEDQIVRILQECQSGQISQAELCRKHGISQGTYYVWKRKYSGMETDDVKRLRELEAENAAPKRMLSSNSHSGGASTTKSDPTRHSATSPPRAMPRPFRKLQCPRNLYIYE